MNVTYLTRNIIRIDWEDEPLTREQVSFLFGIIINKIKSTNLDFDDTRKCLEDALERSK